MKHLICLGFCLGLLSTPFAWAGETRYSENNASTLVEAGALSVVAAPLLITAGTVGVVSGTAAEVVKLVGATGGGLSELTADSLNEAADYSDSGAYRHYPPNHTTTDNYQEIPIIARKQYVQFNERIED